MQIHINRNGETFGPYTLDQVNGYLLTGKLQTGDMAWHEGLSDWLPLAQVAGIQTSRPTPLPPPLPHAPSTGFSPHADSPEQAIAYGGFWIRVGAVCVDIVILLIPLQLLSFLIRGAEPGMDSDTFDCLDSLFSSLVWWIYYAVLESSPWQGTLGKKLLGLKVVDDNGKRISFGRATGRYFAKVLSTLILFIGFVMIGFTRRKQGLHDKIVGTLVVKRNNAN